MKNLTSVLFAILLLTFYACTNTSKTENQDKVSSESPLLESKSMAIETGNSVDNIAIMVNIENKDLLVFEPDTASQDSCSVNQVTAIPFGKSIAVYMLDDQFYWELEDSVSHQKDVNRQKISDIYSKTGAKLYKMPYQDDWHYIIIGEDNIRDASMNNSAGVNLSLNSNRKVYFQVEKTKVGEIVQYKLWVYSTKPIITSFDSSYVPLCY